MNSCVAADRFDPDLPNATENIKDLIDWSALISSITDIVDSECTSTAWEIDGPPRYSSVYGTAYHEDARSYVDNLFERLPGFFEKVVDAERSSPE